MDALPLRSGKQCRGARHGRRPSRPHAVVGGPQVVASHEHLSSFSAAVSAGGRLFYIVDLGPLSSVRAATQWFLIARDAFSGVVLWQRPLLSWEDHMLGSRAGRANCRDD